MKAMRMVGPRKSTVVDVPDLQPTAGQVLVKIKYNGICMSEWHPWDEAKGGERMGHEPMGTVAALGEGVAGKLRVEKSGDPVAIVGTGYMGLGLLTLLRFQEAGKVIAVDPRVEARENALRFGADEVYSPDAVPERYIVTRWDDTMHARGIQLVGEFSGVESGLRLAGDMTGIHGTLGVGGWHQGGDRTVDFRLWGWKGITVINTHERREAYQAACCRNALELLSSGRWCFKGLTNHFYGLNEFDRANEDLANKPKGYVKGLIRCSEW